MDEPGYAQFEALYNGTALYFAEVDSHTDVAELIGTDGQAAGYSYDAYGNATSAISGGVYNPYRYTSQYLDEETGLYYLRARYYDPSNGRFTQEDSYLGEENNPLTLNLYMYCHGNPLMFRDLSGHVAGVAAGAAALKTVKIIAGIVVVVVVVITIYVFAAEHTKNKRKSTYDKHTKPRPGRPSEKKKQKPGWKPR